MKYKWYQFKIKVKKLWPFMMKKSHEKIIKMKDNDFQRERFLMKEKFELEKEYLNKC